MYKGISIRYRAIFITPTEVTSLTNSTFHPMLVSMWDMYIGNGEKAK